MRWDELSSKYAYLIEYDDEDNIYIGRCAELPSVMAHGSSQEKALREIRTAVEAVLADMAEDGDVLPQPLVLAKYSGKLPLRMAPEIHRKLTIKASIAGVSINQYILSKICEE